MSDGVAVGDGRRWKSRVNASLGGDAHPRTNASNYSTFQWACPTDIPTSPSFILLRGLPRSRSPSPLLLLLPAARGGTLFLAPAFSRWFRRVYSTRRKSHLPTEGPTPEGLLQRYPCNRYVFHNET